VFAIPVVGSGHAFVDAPDFLPRDALLPSSALAGFDFVGDAAEDTACFAALFIPERTEADVGVDCFDGFDGFFVFMFFSCVRVNGPITASRGIA
jgi:hypothetical protein